MKHGDGGPGESPRPDLSFIVPAYNEAATLARCLDSILSLSRRCPIECIVVDDGSTDRTAVVAKRYARRNASVRLIVQPRANAGVARNRGMAEAGGEYLWFVDADDEILPATVPDLVRGCLAASPDVLVLPYRVSASRSGRGVPMDSPDRDAYLSDRRPAGSFRAADYPAILETHMYPWNKLFRRRFVEEKGLRFSDAPVNNDLHFTLAALLAATRLSIADEEVYIHRRGDASRRLSGQFGPRRLALLGILDECDALVAASGASNDVLLGYACCKLNLLSWVLVSTRDPVVANRFREYWEKTIAGMTPEFLASLLRHRSAYPSLAALDSMILGRLPPGSIGILDKLQPVRNEPCLSMIVAARDSNPAIRQSLASLARQTLPDNLYEVVMIDASPDGAAGPLLREFSAMKPNFHSHSWPDFDRNDAFSLMDRAVELTRGGYVGTLHAEDIARPDMLEKLLLSALLRSPDLVLCDSQGIVTDAARPQGEGGLLAESLKNDGGKAACLAVSPSPWRAMLRREPLVSGKLGLPDSGSPEAVAAAHWRCVMDAGSIAFVDAALAAGPDCGERGEGHAGRADWRGILRQAESVGDLLKKRRQSPRYRAALHTWLMRRAARALPSLPARERRALLAGVAKVLGRPTLADLASLRGNAGRRTSRSELARDYFWTHSRYRLGLFAAGALRGANRLYGGLKKWKERVGCIW